MQDYNYIDLFAGVGGFSLGAHMAGMKFKEHFASEIDPFCVELYQKRFPDSIQLGDINNIDCDELKKKYGDKWILTGGFPCQNISRAGKKDGITNENESGLWLEYLRLIGELQPRYAIIENVGDICSRGLSTVIGNIAKIRYDSEWSCIQACDVGLPNIRERMWIVAYPQSDRQKSLSSISKIIYETQQKTATLDAQSNHFLQFENWSGEPAVFRMDVRIPGAMDRLAAVGNSIVPIIAKSIWIVIKDKL